MNVNGRNEYDLKRDPENLLGNDKVSSFRIGKGVRAFICRDEDCHIDSWDDVIELLGPYNIGQVLDDT